MENWPVEMDALVAASGFHRLAMENDRVRVLETRIEPGQVVPMHTHCWPSANYVLSFSDFVRRDEKGVVLVDSRLAGIELSSGQAFWGEPLPLHTLENVGESPIHVISVEMKHLSPCN